jgi:hypothetical protein
MTSHVPVVALDDAAADANASTVREALAELDRLVKPPLGVSPHFKSCWAQVTTVRSSLSDRRPLRNIDRDHFFRELNRICADLKRIQDEYWLERNTTSERAHSYVLSDIQSARFAADGARDTDGLREAYAKLQEIREQLTSHDSSDFGSQMLRDARSDCWRALDEAREALRYRREKFQDVAYSELSGPVADVGADAGRDPPREVFPRIKELHREVSAAFLSKLQREELRNTLRSAWETASARTGEQRGSWQEKLEEKETMFEEMIERKRGIIEKIEANLEDLRSKEIWNDEYAQRIDEWIDEGERKIADIEAEISELEAKLASVRERLSRV